MNRAVIASSIIERGDTMADRYQQYGFGHDRPAIRNEATGFPAGDASASIVSGPIPGMLVINTGDPLSVLPRPAREKVEDLKRRREEFSLLYRADFENEQALRAEIFKHEARIAELQKPRGEGGFGLGSDDMRVTTEQEKLGRKRNDLARLLVTKEARGAESQRLGALLRNIEQMIAARPAGTVGRMIEIERPSFKGDLLDAIERRRARTRELRADEARARCAPRPSAVRKAAMVAQVEALAEQGRPDVASSIEHGEPITWPLTNHRFDVFNASPGAISFGQLVDIVAFMAWWDRQGMIERLSAELDAVSDDAAALSDQQRREQEAQILADLLVTEREECALIDLARKQGLPAEHRSDCDARAVLAIEWVPAPPSEPREGAGEAGLVRHIGS
ncbi:hypothetical protein [Bradyrhizobium sp. UNPA324]|uniref:hypothetical protein n=1 Tax=Bradyrhizobium sp. UNPA324 TaxID=1141174 RepID=UPI001153A7DF|nr:hypothetical protein [Bradyrhizobium sp. UNPA324]TQF30012.1 hypothetical protein UNPA324_10535 [Bradyrhizobium sp. UNPA324]